MSRPTQFWLFVATGLLLVGSSVTGRCGEPNNERWDRTKATHYLDSREQEWFDFGSANRGEGTSKTTCVSCHSLLPYALARPALRRESKDDQPTKLEAKILAQVKSRVANWDRLDTPEFQLSYDFDEDKKKQSRGTEAVLYALILSLDDRSRGMNKPSADTEHALTNLWATQLTQGEFKGSWEWLNFGLEPWESPRSRYLGATLAAIAVGTSIGSAGPQEGVSAARSGSERLRGYLTQSYGAQNLHNRVWLLWASTTMDGLLQPEQKKPLIEQIVAKQQDGGGWSLATLGDYKKKDISPDIGKSDGYATGLIVHVLQLAGVPKDESHIRAGLDWLRSNQDTAGGWRAWSLNKIREPESPNPAKAHIGKFMWDAATAFSILALSH